MSNSAVLDQLLDPFAQCLNDESAQRVIELGIAPSVQKRLDYFAKRANEGLLTEVERADYEALVDAADFISILKLKAQRKLAANG